MAFRGAIWIETSECFEVRELASLECVFLLHQSSGRQPRPVNTGCMEVK